MFSPSSADLALDRAPGRQLVHAVERAQEGRLAAARGADQRRHLVRLDRHVDVFDRVEVAVEEVDVLAPRSSSPAARPRSTSAPALGRGGRQGSSGVLGLDRARSAVFVVSRLSGMLSCSFLPCLGLADLGSVAAVDEAGHEAEDHHDQRSASAPPPRRGRRRPASSRPASGTRCRRRRRGSACGRRRGRR